MINWDKFSGLLPPESIDIVIEDNHPLVVWLKGRITLLDASIPMRIEGDIVNYLKDNGIYKTFEEIELLANDFRSKILNF